MKYMSITQAGNRTFIASCGPYRGYGDTEEKARASCQRKVDQQAVRQNARRKAK